MAEEILDTPITFRRIWFHKTEVRSEICSGGWNPEKNKRTIFGTAIYLARREWDSDDLFGELLCSIDRTSVENCLKHRKMIACVLALRANEVMSCFAPEIAPDGITDKHLFDYLNKNVPAPRGQIRRVGSDGTSTVVRYGPTPGPGNSERNKAIARHFLAKGIKAIRFLERGEEVVAVYDPNCIRVLPKSTVLDEHPFPDMLAPNEPGPSV